MPKKEEEVKIEQKKFYRMRDRNGRTFRFDAANYGEAQDWTKKQLMALGEVYPRDLASLEECE